MSRRTLPIKRLSACLLAATTIIFLVVGVASPGARKPKVIGIREHIKTSITRAPDGTVTLRVTYTASDPRCFSSGWLKKLGDGYYHTDGSVLKYSQFGPRADANPPGNGWLVPKELNVSPSVWEAVWPGADEVHIQEADTAVEGATVADATSVYLDVQTPSNSNHFNKYIEDGEKTVLACYAPSFDLERHF
jgi:hypothetical protein